MGTIALSSAFSSAFSATLSVARGAIANQSNLYCRAIPSLRASHPLAGSTVRTRSRRLGHGVALPNQSSASAPPCMTPVAAAPFSRLRILREFEPGAHPAAAGRMVISGRMIDVCAELDRMVSAEALKMSR